MLFAQQLFAQQQLITLNARNEALHSIFASITAQTDLRFSYNSQLIDDNQKRSITVEKQTLHAVLPMILPQAVTYKFVGKHVILSPTAAVVQQSEPIEQRSQELPAAIEETENIAAALPEFIPEETSAIETHLLVTSNDSLSFEKELLADNGTLLPVCLDNKLLKTEEMKKSRIAAFCAGFFAASTMVAAPANDSTQLKTQLQATNSEKRDFQFSFLYPLGSDGAQTANNEYNLSLNLLYGITGKVNGAEFAGLLNINKQSLSGAQFAGFINFTGMGSNAQLSRGVQFAGWGNYNAKGRSEQFGGFANMGDSATVQMAGFANLANAANVQLSGFAGIAKQSTVQASGFANVANSAHAQMAGFANIAKETKLQLSGFSNLAEQAVVQMSGFANIANSTKVQIAGASNIAHESKCQISAAANVTGKGGFQMGIVNVRDSVDGVSLGLINIVRKGGLKELEISGSESLHTAISFRSGSKKLYGIVAVGVNFDDEFLAFGGGLGSEIALREKLGINIEVAHYNLFGASTEYKSGGLTQFRPTLNFAPIKQLKLYVGPTFNLLYSNLNEIVFTPPYNFWEWNNANHKGEAWVGITGGVRICF